MVLIHNVLQIKSNLDATSDANLMMFDVSRSRICNVKSTLPGIILNRLQDTSSLLTSFPIHYRLMLYYTHRTPTPFFHQHIISHVYWCGSNMRLPVITNLHLLCPTTISTTPISALFLSRTGPCSTCNSRNVFISYTDLDCVNPRNQTYHLLHHRRQQPEWMFSSSFSSLRPPYHPTHLRHHHTYHQWVQCQYENQLRLVLSDLFQDCTNEIEILINR